MPFLVAQKRQLRDAPIRRGDDPLQEPLEVSEQAADGLRIEEIGGVGAADAEPGPYGGN